MKALITLVFLTSILFAIPVQGGQYLTEAQKEALLRNSGELAAISEKEHAQSRSEKNKQPNIVKQQNGRINSHQLNSKYLGANSTHKTSRIIVAPTRSRNQTQSLQSAFRSTNWNSPSKSNHINQQNGKVVNTAHSYSSIKKAQQNAATPNHRSNTQQSRQVAKTARKAKWSNFFKKALGVVSQIGHGINQSNSQFKPYTPQPTRFTPQPTHFTPQQSNQIIQTMRVGNQTINVGGNHELRTWNVGNQTFGTFDNKKVKMYNFGDFSHGTIGGEKVRCHKAGELTFCK
ncbi:MAG: hypothetical protein V2I48_06365 [Xanthomonadales bacterium]|nr:hypothetical protein [Xanthomonadales bacterium]